MSDIEIKESHIHLNGKNYFRGNAFNVGIASYGDKKTPITQENYLLVQGQLPIPRIKVKRAAILQYTGVETTEKHLFANIKVAVVFGGKQNTALQDLRESRLKLVLFTIEPAVLKDAANDTQKALDELIEDGDGARIVNEVIVAMKADMAQAFDSASSFEISANAGAVKVSIGGGVSSSANGSYTLSKDTTFGYGMLKPKWDAHQKKNKTKIISLDNDDQWGPF